MSDFPGYSKTPITLSTYSHYCDIWDVRNHSGAVGAASASWATTNQARYYPISIPFDYVVRRVFWMNGSALGNCDFGIYTFEGKRLYSTTSTAQSGASALQFVTPGTAIWLTPGTYYFAWNNDGTTNRAWGATTAAAIQRFGGVLQQAVGAVTLPDPATFAAATVAGVNLCGVTWTTSGI